MSSIEENISGKDVISSEENIEVLKAKDSKTVTTPKEDSVPISFQNPTFSDSDNEQDLEKIKGDAIGNTVYSERFVLSTLLKLTRNEKDLSEDESFEKDLCSLWDMTVDADVVKLLLKYNVLELFAGNLESTNDKRLAEILVGMIANMCYIQETRDELCANAEVTASILSLISCTDSLTLIQLMRFLYVIIPFENSDDEIAWFEHFRKSEDFIEHFSFLLCNSMNHKLLIDALEALNVIIAKFVVIETQQESNELSFSEMFVKESLIKGTIEAFKTLLPAKVSPKKQIDRDTATPSQNVKKVMSLFLDIHVILSQYDTISHNCYQAHMSDLLKCISQILSPLCQPINLLPLTSNEQGIIENVTEILQALDPLETFNEVCFAQMITIWNLIDAAREAKERSNRDSDDSIDDDDEVNDEVNSEDIYMTILEFITRNVRGAASHQLQAGLRLHSPRTVMKLLSALSVGDPEEDIKECCVKIKNTFEILNSAPNGSQSDST